VLKEDAGVALRGLFIISPEQKIEQITINNMGIGRNVDEAKRLLQAIQFVAEHGEAGFARPHAFCGLVESNFEGGSRRLRV
jgi:alkyl hydroperoxide reductase subunit AhpC